jgi:sodium-dependent dicarboxylate transporter 2/3/5
VEPLAHTAPETRANATELRFAHVRHRIGIVLGPIVFLGLLFFPFPELSSEAHKLAAVAGLIIVFWVTEAIPLPVTGVLGPLLIVILGIAPASKSFAAFADPIIFLFLGAFILARAISLHGLDRRLAYVVLSIGWIDERPGRILFAFGAVCCVLSMWISNTATTAMMFPIALAIISTLQRISDSALGRRYAVGIMLMCAYAASIGGIATPVGTPPNLIGLGFIQRQLGRHIPFLEWMSFALPIVAVLYGVLFVYLYVLCPSGIRQFTGVRTLMNAEREKLGTLSRGERNTLYAFGTTVTLWLLPGILSLALGADHSATRWFIQNIPESAAALIGATMLFFLPIHWRAQEFTISLKSALHIDWGVLALFGGGLALGQLALETGLAESVVRSLAGVIPRSELLSMIFTTSIATLATEFTSNTAAANMLVPVVLLLSNTAALKATIATTMAVSLAFVLPVSTPSNAIVYSSGHVPLSQMIKHGLLLDIIGIIVIIVGATLLVPAQ